MNIESKNKNSLATEWTTLQNQYDSYEKHSLYIKLVAILVCIVFITLKSTGFLSAALLAVFWLQDGIWKTFQSRIEPRLLKIEEAIAENTQIAPFQFNRNYQQQARSGAGLIGEYLRQSLRPTVAFPHAILIVLSLLVPFIQR